MSATGQAKGGKKTGGRPKGSRNKSTLAALAFFAPKDFDPLERLIAEYEESRNLEDALLTRLADEHLDDKQRKRIASSVESERRDRIHILKELAPYRHPKLRHTTFDGDTGPLTVHVNLGGKAKVN